MEINKLDLAKTISDFMFLWIDNYEEKAKKLFELKHSLDNRWHWFEKYMQYYFQKFWKYSVKLNWKTNSFDDWIDLLWEKIENGKKKKLIVQCKKYNIKDITYDDVASFYGKISDIYLRNKENTKVYYITTSKFTQKAKDFLNEKWIIPVDFEKIAEAQEKYPLNLFKQEIQEKEWKKQAEKCLQKEQILLDFDDSIINTIEAKDIEVLQLLKQIRRDLSYKRQLRLWDIAKNDTLKLLSRERPYNNESLRRFASSLPIREKNKLLRYWSYFTERLKYLHHQEINIKTIKNDSILRKILKSFT